MSFLITQSGEGSQNYKTAVRAASSANVALSGSAPILLGGVTLANNDRILLKDQGLPAQNGIYVVSISGGAYTMVRASDANTSREVVPNMLVPVAEGTYADQLFQLTTNGPIVLDTTPLSFGFAVLYDHGLLPGLGDDDHLQYHTDARAETWLSTKGTTTVLNENAVDVDFRVEGLTDSNLLFVDASTNRVGIGNNSPNAKLQVNNSGTQLGLSVYSTSSNNTAEFYNQGTTNYTLALNSAANSAMTGASIGGYFARGTLSSRAQTLANDSLLSISASGHTGSSVAGISAAIVLAADQNTTASAFGGQIVFATTANTTVALPTPKVVIKNDGKMGIGTLLPSELLEVAGNVKAHNILFAADNTYNLGAPTGSRPANVYVKNSVVIDTLTTQRLLVSGPSKEISFLGAGYPSLTEISYVTGVTSAIQTQLNDKEKKGYYTRIAKSANYSIAATDDYIGCDSTGGSFTVTLPAVVPSLNGKRIIVKDEGGAATTNNIFIAPNGTDEIDGSNTSESLVVGYESITLVCDGANGWFII